MGEVFMTGQNRRNPLCFSVWAGQKEPENPGENEIWVNTGEKIAQWAIAPSNPWTAYRDEQMLHGKTIAAGYFGSSGSILARNEERQEVYCVEHIPVEYGKTYEYAYTTSAQRSQWLAICEYGSSDTFIKRIMAVNGVEGTEATGTYTPSSLDVISIRLSWRTYGDAGCTMNLIEPDVAYTREETPEGVLWIQTDGKSKLAFSAVRKNNLLVQPYMIRRYAGGVWSDMPAYLYQDGEWKTILGERYLFNQGDVCQTYTGGWKAESGTMTFLANYVKFVGSEGAVMRTENLIDMTEYSILRFCLRAGSKQNVTLAGADTTEEKDVFAAVCEIPMETTAFTVFDVDISALTGGYYAKIQTSAPVEGCYMLYAMLIR